MKNQNEAKSFLIMFLLVSVLILLDQLAKNYAVGFFAEPVTLIKNFFYLKTVFNEGVAFSISLPFLAIIILNLVMLGLICFLAAKELDFEKFSSKFFVALILGGGISNIIDRFSYGSVVDFISIWKWPSFNPADIYITAGVILTIVFFGRIKKVK